MLIITFIISYVIYGSNINNLPIHWNIYGTPDNYAKKEEVSLLIPSITVLIYLLMKLLPKIDPLSKNIKKFEKDYEVLITILVGFMTAVNGYILLWSKGIFIPTNAFIGISLSILFIYISIFLKKTKRNLFIGIRTPWTISSKKVWEKTHALGSKLFLIISLISLLILFNSTFVYVLLVSLIITTILLFIYSFIEFQKIKNKK